MPGRAFGSVVRAKSNRRVRCTAYVTGLDYETVRNSVPWRFDYAIGKRSSNMIANWLFTACHSRTERFHS